MENIPNKPISRSERAYYRSRLMHKIYGEFVKFFGEMYEKNHITKKIISERIGCDPSYVSKLLNRPSNMTIETMSDLLLSVEAEIENIKIIRIKDRIKHNYANDFYSKLCSIEHEDCKEPYSSNEEGTFVITAVSSNIDDVSIYNSL